MDTEATTRAQGANTGPNVIRANQFILEDDKGTTRAVLDVDKDGEPGLYLYDDKGTPRVIMGVGAHGSVLALCDMNGKTLVSLAVSNDGSSMRLSDERGKPRLRLTVGNDGVPGLALLYENGVNIWSKP
jgi:hypothetical protein